MNFEIIDNVFQVAVFFVAALGDMVYWFYKRDRLYIILALVHSCFMMGTLYFVLHLVIRGVVPQVFYVSEISWNRGRRDVVSLFICTDFRNGNKLCQNHPAQSECRTAAFERMLSGICRNSGRDPNLQRR